jgi:hypothetical protein
MNGLDLWDLRQKLDEANILICFNGPLSQSIIEQLGVAVKRYLEAETHNAGRLYDVFAVYIEQSQNIQNYTASKAVAQAASQTVSLAELQRYDSATIAIGRLDDDHYLVTSGNPVAKSDLPPLTALLDALAKLDAEGLKACYREQRRRPREDGSPSAGLGLIDMARKSSRPLEYRVRDIDADTAYFHLTAVI